MAYDNNSPPIGGVPQPRRHRPRQGEGPPNGTTEHAEPPEVPEIVEETSSAVEEAPQEASPPEAKPARKKPQPRLRPKLPQKYRSPQKELLVKIGLVAAVLVCLAVAVVALKGVVMILVVLILLLALPFAFDRKILDRFLPVRYEPEEPVPGRGLRGIFWKLIGERMYVRLGWQWIATPSWAERDALADEKLWEFRDVQKIIAFANSKGGSAKTALAVWLIAFYAHVIKRLMTAFDVNESPGSTSDRLGIDEGHTIQLRAYLKKFEAGGLGSLASFFEEADSHRQTGVMVIASDPVLNEQIALYKFREALKNVKLQAHTVVCDLGNEIKGPTNRGSVEMAQTLVFAGNVHMANSEKDLGKTMQRYSNLGVPVKVRNSVIIVVGDKVRTNKQIYRQRMVYAQRYTEVMHEPNKENGGEPYAPLDFEFPLARVHVIPFNQYMAKGKVVDVNKIPRKIKVLLKEALIAVVRAEVVPEETHNGSIADSERSVTASPTTE